jgi:hypothetical protein
MLERPSRRRERRSRRRERVVRLVLVAVLLVLAFLLGIAFARTLEERPQPGDVVTTVRTLTAGEEAATSTVTVTVTEP